MKGLSNYLKSSQTALSRDPAEFFPGSPADVSVCAEQATLTDVQHLQSDNGERSADLAALVPDYPVAYDAGKALAAAAARAGTHDFDVMWCGAGPVRDDALPATGLVRALMAETDAALA